MAAFNVLVHGMAYPLMRRVLSLSPSLSLVCKKLKLLVNIPSRVTNAFLDIPLLQTAIQWAARFL
jgi:hypothetical protein